MSGIKGGQGRSEQDIENSALMLCYLAAAAALALVIWGLLS